MSTKTNEELTPFEKAGYTEATKFKVLVNDCDLRVGDIVTLYDNDGSICPRFISKDGRWDCMYLPDMTPESYDDWLEVYEGDK